MVDYTTPTTPSGPIYFACPHMSFQAETSVDRHEQTTDGNTRISYTATLRIKCKDCGTPMKFPMMDGSFTTEAKTSMVA